MEKEFVPYELALKMKQLGFDEPCLGVFELIVVGDTIPKFRYNWEGEDKWFNHNKEKDEFKDHDWYWSAPTFSQAFRWFREKYEIFGIISSEKDDNYYNTEFFGYSVYKTKVNAPLSIGLDLKENASYEEAELACLDKLIEIVESK
jgi:hypothetical protein